jgi:hypothetical protein
MKLLLDTFELLRFRTSDRKKSLAIEKAEAQRRLYSNMGKSSRLLDDTSLVLSNGTYRDFRSRQKKLLDVVCENILLFNRFFFFLNRKKNYIFFNVKQLVKHLKIVI